MTAPLIEYGIHAAFKVAVESHIIKSDWLACANDFLETPHPIGRYLGGGRSYGVRPTISLTGLPRRRAMVSLARRTVPAASISNIDSGLASINVRNAAAASRKPQAASRDSRPRRTSRALPTSTSPVTWPAKSHRPTEHLLAESCSSARGYTSFRAKGFDWLQGCCADGRVDAEDDPQADGEGEGDADGLP